MNLKQKITRKIVRTIYAPAESVFRKIERSELSRGAVLRQIPPAHLRGGGLGTTTYGEWAYTVGLFSGMIFESLPKRPIRMLDVGCGVGRLYLAAKPYLIDDDRYTGIDVGERFIKISREHYTDKNVEFIHTSNSNAYYTGSNASSYEQWPFEDGSKNLITALSVWTHLREEDWRYYLSEVARVLSSDGRAIISFFILDELYKPQNKRHTLSRFYPQPENKWVFDSPAYKSLHWKTPAWAHVPEVAIAVPKAIFYEEVMNSGLQVEKYFPGQWKDQPGFFFQDVAVLIKRQN